jgi:hypothetical protein
VASHSGGTAIVEPTVGITTSAQRMNNSCYDWFSFLSVLNSRLVKTSPTSSLLVSSSTASLEWLHILG